MVNFGKTLVSLCSNLNVKASSFPHEKGGSYFDSQSSNTPEPGDLSNESIAKDHNIQNTERNTESKVLLHPYEVFNQIDFPLLSEEEKDKYRNLLVS
jgi:hypothetical protein